MNSMGFISVFNPKIIFKSWVDSLKIFLPSNLIPFLSTTFKSFVGGMKVFIIHYLWQVIILSGVISIFFIIPGVYVIFYVLEVYLGRSETLGWGGFFTPILEIIFATMLVFFLAWIAAIRNSSVETKKLDYFKFHPSILIVFFILILWSVFPFLLMFDSKYSKFLDNLVPNYAALLIIIDLFIKFNVIWFSFLGLTKHFSDIFKSLWKTFVFIVHNIPGLMVLNFVSILAAVSLNRLEIDFFTSSKLGVYVLIGISIIYLMISSCILYNYFVQRVNADKKLYL